MRVSWETAREMFAQNSEIEISVDHDRRHAGAAIGARHGHAIGRGVDDPWAIAKTIIDLAGCDVLALPAEGIAEAIDKIEETLLILPHQVAGAKPGIAFREDIAQNFLVGLACIGIALEAAAAVARVADAPDRFADLVASGCDAKPVIAARGLVTFRIDLDDRRGKAMRQQRREPADRTDLALDIVKGKIALRSSVEFEDARNGKALFERFPDIAAKPVAAGEPQPMLAFEFGNRRLQ